MRKYLRSYRATSGVSMNDKIEFLSTVDNEEGETFQFMVKAEVTIDSDEYAVIESLELYTSQHDDVTCLIEFGWPHCIETIKEQIVDLARERKRDRVNYSGNIWNRVG